MVRGKSRPDPLKRFWCAAAVIFFVFLPVFPGAAALTVREITVRSLGEKQVDPDYVLARTRTFAGMELDNRVVERDVRALLDTGRYAYVAAEVEPLREENEVRLVYVVEAKRQLARPVRISGARKVRRTKLRKWSGLEPGDYVSEADAAVAALDVSEKLRKERYSQADVQAQYLPDARNPLFAEVRLLVDEGPRTRLQRVEFEGNTVFSDAELRRAMALPRRWNPMNWFRRQPYRPAALESAAVNVRERYRNAGYLDARVEQLETREVAPGLKRVSVPVFEGPRYRLGDLSIDGVTVLDEDELLERIDVGPGQTAALSGIAAAAQTVRDAYSVRGYRGTGVAYDLVPHPEEPLVDLRFRVHEGELTDIRMVHIRGNRITRDKVIRRELLVSPGDRFDETRIRRSERRLYNLGYFSSVGSYARDMEEGVCDLVFEVEEQHTGQLMLGAGFSSIDRVVGFVEVSQGNFSLFDWPRFMGAGQKLNLRAQFGSKSRDYRISFVEPWFLDRRLSLGVDGYVEQRRYREYEVERTGGALSLGLPLRGPHRLDMTYRLERSDLVRVADTNLYIGADGGDFYFAQEGKRDKSAYSLFVSRDTRDRFFRPTRGHTVRLGGTYAGGWLGADTDIYGLEARAAIYVPLWFRHVFGLHGRVEVVDTHSGYDDVPLPERLFAGGQGSVRGFRYRQVGPKASRLVDETTVRRRPQGGRTRTLLTAEYSLPLFDPVSLSCFADAGNVQIDAYDISTDNIAVGAGFGLRFDIPGFPIRFDYAWPLRRDDPYTRTERFSFHVGHGF